MPESVFPWPGGKFYHVDWIVSHFPQHECYVEPFGGAATVLVNKPPGKHEIFNDLDDNIVHFFDVLRDREEELVKWLRNVPYSRSLLYRFRENFYEREYPDDPVERAGQFFYLRLGQPAAAYYGRAGFLASPNRQTARQWTRAKQRLNEFSERFDTVTLENRDYQKIVDMYDGDETLFYCDPPYVGGEHHYAADFGHETFVDLLSEIDGKFVVSYSDVPDCLDLDDYHVREKGGKATMSMRQTQAVEQTEKIIMNFNPDQTPTFAGAAQSTLTDGGFDG